MAENTEDPAVEPDQPTAEQPETGEQAKAEKTVPIADLVKERKERQRLTKELEALRTASLSEAEKAVAEAEKRGEAKATERYVGRLVEESFRAATSGKALKADALLSFDRKQFVTEDGDVDRDGLAAWIEQHATDPGPRRPTGDIDQGIKPGAAPEPDDPASLAAAALAQRGY